MAALGRIPGWRCSWCPDRRRLALVDGLDLGEAARHRSDGTRRREDDVHGRRLSRLASDDPDYLHGCIFGIDNWDRGDGGAGAARSEDLFTLWHLPGNRRNRGAAHRPTSRGVVRWAV